jgi:hypothetical protein
MLNSRNYSGIYALGQRVARHPGTAAWPPSPLPPGLRFEAGLLTAIDGTYVPLSRVDQRPDGLCQLAKTPCDRAFAWEQGQ